MSVVMTAGALIAGAGICTLVWCIWRAAGLRGSDAADAEIRAVFRKLTILNFVALGLALVGLALIVAGGIVGGA
jgi:hypothetical protein